MLRTRHRILAPTALLTCALTSDLQASDPHVFLGTFTSTFEAGPGCVDSPIQLCTHGILSGDWVGTYEFSFTSQAPSGNPEAPNEILYTGNSVITLSNGAMIFENDTSAMYPDATGHAAFTTIVTVVGGTKNYGDAAGEIVAWGDIDLINGTAVGSYRAVIDKDADDDNDSDSDSDSADSDSD